MALLAASLPTAVGPVTGVAKAVAALESAPEPGIGFPEVSEQGRISFVFDMLHGAVREE